MNAHAHPHSEKGADVFVWPTVGKPGFVPIDSLVPGPFQPRQFFDESELQALADTIKSGGQREILTVRELTEDEKASGKYPPAARYVIVSGERRWRASKLAGLDEIEIRVKEYQSFADEAEDAYMLNEGRVALTDIENARALRQLADLRSWKTQKEVAKMTGKSEFLISDLFQLLELSPKAQEKFSSSLPKRERFARQVGVYIAQAKIDHATQDSLVERMPKEAVTTMQRINWIKEDLESSGVTVPTRRREPRRMRNLIEQLVAFIDQRVTAYSADADIERIFENMAPEAKRIFLHRLKRSVEGYAKLAARIKSMGESAPAEAASKPAFDPKEAAAKFMERSGKAPDLRPAPRPSVPVAPTATMRRPVPASEPEDEPEPQQAPKPVLVVALKPKPKEYVVNCYDEALGRMVMKSLSPSQYVQMHDRGLLEFQQRQRPKPEHLPSREEAVRMSS